MKATPFLFILLGLLIMWLGVNGKLFAFIGSAMIPEEVEVKP